jgi:hypothetical protein
MEIGEGRQTSACRPHHVQASLARMTVGIFTTPESDAQILTIDRWWRRERPAAPNLFAEELAAAFELLASVPKAGR